MSQTEYAEHRGISQQRISKLIETGKIDQSCITKIGKYKKIDKDKADAALKQNLDRIYNPNRSSQPKKDQKKAATKKEREATVKAAGMTGMSMADAQKMQAKLKAALLKLDYDERLGTLISAEKVRTDVFNIARITRDAILNIPDRISAELASITDIHVEREKLTAELTQALEELSNGKF